MAKWKFWFAGAHDPSDHKQPETLIPPACDSAVYPTLQKMLGSYKPSEVDRRISPSETMRDDNYFWVGESAVDVVVRACMASQLTEVKRVLDMPCGHGRVLRHLVRLFADAAFDACDLDAVGVDFCAATFGARPILSKEDLTTVEFDGNYDLIWVGSLFTHLSYEITRKWLAFLGGLLSEKGIVVATFHGRWSTQRPYPYTDDQRWAQIMAGYEATGYGYQDYAKGKGHAFVTGSYGLSVSKPHVILKMLEEIPGTRIYMYREKAWGDHQDVAVFGRPDWRFKMTPVSADGGVTAAPSKPVP
jgi:SAM-dependent methyltransferase